MGQSVAGTDYGVLAPLTAQEPDWTAVDQAGQSVCAQLEKDFATHPDHPLLASVRALPLVDVWDHTALS